MAINLKIGVCLRAKDEQNIIVDWIIHYLKLGFDKIIIYDNLSIPSIKETLDKKNILNNKIEILIDNIEYSNQHVLYNDCINNNKDLDWIFFCDADEFLYLKDNTIKNFLNEYSDDTCTILINWLVYGTNNLKTYDNSKCIFEQFTKRENYNHFWNNFVKCFVRPKLIDTTDLSNHHFNVHIIYNKKYKLKNVYNQECTSNMFHDRCDYLDYELSDNTNIILVHYMTLDFESMKKKHHRNIKGSLLENNDTKYSLKWYTSNTYGFRDNNVDFRMLKYQKTNIYFIITNNENHKSILDIGGGASELLFYTTAYYLSSYYNVTIFNHGDSYELDNIKYLKIPDNFTEIVENINDSIFIVQRFFNYAIDLHKTNLSNKYILWSHDFLESKFPHLSNNYSPKEINEYFKNNNIETISVSNFHKNNINQLLPDINVTSIYNALFSKIYINQTENIEVNKNRIIFASNWSKGLDKILLIGKEYYKRNKDFKLILIKPEYCDWSPNLSQYLFIECKGTIKNKKEYCDLLQSCLCLLTTSYPETFGCVFAEALHLGVPVIGDNSVEAGFHEIIDKNYLCNFNKPYEVINKIEEFRKERPTVKLDEKFYESSIINDWIKIL